LKIINTRLKFGGALLSLLFIFGAGEAKADPVTINFDDAPQGEVAHTRYVPQGLMLMSGFMDVPGSLTFFYPGFRVVPVGGSNAAFSANTNGEPRWQNLYGVFFYAGTPNAATASFLSFDVVGMSPGSLDSWRVVVYDWHDKVLDTVNGTGNGTVIFSRAFGEITSFVFFGGTASQGIDNVRFQTEPLPEPATLTLFATGLIGGIGALARRRRRNAATSELTGNL
jgi:PEP-CTERM motif